MVLTGGGGNVEAILRIYCVSDCILLVRQVLSILWHQWHVCMRQIVAEVGLAFQSAADVR